MVTWYTLCCQLFKTDYRQRCPMQSHVHHISAFCVDSGQRTNTILNLFSSNCYTGELTVVAVVD